MRRLRVGVRLGVTTELHQEESVAVGEQVDVVGVQTLRAHVFDELVVDALEAHWSVLADLRHVVSGGVGIGIAEHDQRARRLGVDQPHGRVQHDDAGPLGPDESLRDVEAVLGEQAGRG